MEPLLSLTDFEASLKRAGMELTDEQVKEIYTGWTFLEPLIGRLRAGTRPRAAEPAHVFNPMQPLS
jgi:hypothetical protein